MYICGIDEVGRGCLAGPVVACAVVLPESFADDRIRDSKKLSEKKRELLTDIVRQNACAIGIGVVCSSLVDNINILRATKQAMHLALSRLNHSYDRIIIDAVKLKNLTVPFDAPIKADDTYVQVSAASIIAKVYRDTMMKKLHYRFPEYDWYKNKGYGTKNHCAAIEKFGYTDLHRKSFLGGLNARARQDG